MPPRPPDSSPVPLRRPQDSRHWHTALSLAWTLADEADLPALYGHFRDTQGQAVREFLAAEGEALEQVATLTDGYRWAYARGCFPAPKAAELFLLAALVREVEAAEGTVPPTGETGVAALERALRSRRAPRWPEELFAAAGVSTVALPPGTAPGPTATVTLSSEELTALLPLDIALADQTDDFLLLAEALLAEGIACDHDRALTARQFRGYRVAGQLGATAFEWVLPGVAGVHFAAYFPPGRAPRAGTLELDALMSGKDVLTGVFAQAAAGDPRTAAARARPPERLAPHACVARLRHLQGALLDGLGHVVLGVHFDGRPPAG